MSKLTHTLIILTLPLWLIGLCAHQSDSLSLYEKGKDAYAQGEYELARDLFFQNIEKLKGQPTIDTFKVIKGLTKLADSYRKIRLFPPALAYYEEAMQLANSGGDKYDELFLDAANNRAFVFSKMFQPLKALKCYEAILPLSEKLFGPESADHASIYNSMGIDYYKAGDLFRSTEAFLKALDIFRKTLSPNAEGFNRVYNNLGGNYRKTGDLEKALEYALKALEIKSKNYPADHPSLAKYHMNIGKVYAAMRAPELALPFMERQLEIQQLHFPVNHPNVIGAKGELANIQADLGLYVQALKNNWATLEVDTQYMGHDHPYILAMYTNVAQIYLEMGRYDDAQKIHSIALSKLKQRNYVPPHKMAEMLDLQAAILLARGDKSGALREIISGLRELDVEFSSRGEFDIPDLADIGDAYIYLRLTMFCAEIHEEIYLADRENLVHLIEAVKKSEMALAAMQKLRAGYHSNEARLFLNDVSSEVFKRAVRTSFQYFSLTQDEDYLRKSFKMSELAKSDLLKKMANEGLALKTAGVPETLVEQLDVLRSEIGDLADRIQDYQRGDIDHERIDSLSKLKFNKEEVYNALVRQLERDYPKYYSLKFSSQELEIKRLNKKLRSNNAGLISYFYDEQSIFIFYVNGKMIRGAKVDHGGNLVSDIGQLRSHLTPESALSADSNDWDDLSELCVEFYNQLFLPISEYIKADSIGRLVISPYGVLHYLSFDILHGQRYGGDVRKLDYLIKDYAISYVSSIQLWIDDITIDHRFRNSFSGFAPVYNGSSNETRSGFANLNWNSTEVRQLQSMVGGRALLGLDANKAEFKRSAADSRILHLAMHAIADDIIPMRSGLVFPNSQGSDNGYMNLLEIYNQPVNAELVVLNACNTGFGKVVEGEGVLSIGHAFLYAGAQSLMMNLWLADDQAASNIVTDIYSELHAGQTKDEAVRKAKLKFLSNTDVLRAHPYFWAGMIVQGKNEPFSFSDGSFQLYYYLLSVSGIVLLLLLLRQLRLRPLSE